MSDYRIILVGISIMGGSWHWWEQKSLNEIVIYHVVGTKLKLSVLRMPKITLGCTFQDSEYHPCERYSWVELPVLTKAKT